MGKYNPIKALKKLVDKVGQLMKKVIAKITEVFAKIYQQVKRSWKHIVKVVLGVVLILFAVFFFWFFLVAAVIAVGIYVYAQRKKRKETDKAMSQMEEDLERQLAEEQKKLEEYFEQTREEIFSLGITELGDMYSIEPIQLSKDSPLIESMISDDMLTQTEIDELLAGKRRKKILITTAGAIGISALGIYLFRRS